MGVTKKKKKPIKINVNVPDIKRHFINRELSWLSFNARVLAEARDRSNPLMERVNFLAITCSNLDEFFMIRVASLHDLANAGYEQPDPAGLTPLMQLSALSVQAHRMIHQIYQTYHRSLYPALRRENIEILNIKDLSSKQRDEIKKWFMAMVHPVLTPVAINDKRPFPLVSSQSLYVFAAVTCNPEENGQNQSACALIEVPAMIPRLIPLSIKGKQAFVLLEDVISAHLDTLFGAVRVKPAGCFRVLRNADLAFDEDEAADLLIEIEKQLKQREWGQVIRLEISSTMNESDRKRITSLLRIDETDVYLIDGPIDLTFLRTLKKHCSRSDLFYSPYFPQIPSIYGKTDLFQLIREQDLFLHHPYESFKPVIDWLDQATRDPDVLAIKQTLYRFGDESPTVESLALGAEQGKQVLVLVDARAGIDEENNIHWARRLEQAGCHVIYGVTGLKTHSKITLVVRRDQDKVRRYVHLGTGNYNEITAKLYSDMGLLTCSEAIGSDATAFFNMLSGFARPKDWQALIAAPDWLRSKLSRLVEQATEAALAGKKANLIIKANSLVDPVLIERLYQASCAGVSIDLIIRGICCLRPGLKGVSETIRVRSIIGRFLEHSRIFYFNINGKESLFLSSADWMPRNLDRRIELMFPVTDPSIIRRIMQVLQIQLADTERSWLMDTDGQMKRVDKRGKKRLDCQQYFCDLAIRSASLSDQNSRPEKQSNP